MTPGPRLDLFPHCFARDYGFVGPKVERKRHTRLVQIQSEHATSIRLQQLHRELAHESQASVGSAKRTPCKAIAPSVP